MTPQINSEDLIDSQIVAEILGLSHRNTVTTYLKRYPDMPKPIVELGTGRVRLWLRPDIEAWAENRMRRGESSANDTARKGRGKAVLRR